MGTHGAHGHPRYRGPVIDVHVHYWSGSREHAAAVNRMGGLATAIQLWDVTWPPPRYAKDLDAWRELEPDLLRCHVPDLSKIGDPGFEERLVADVREAASLGCVGVKVWKNLGLKLRDVDGRRIAVDDSRLDALWETIAELKLPVLIHVGDPPEMWDPPTADNPRAGDTSTLSGWWYSDGSYPPLARIHEEFERLVSRHPATTFIGAHFGCFLSTDELHRWLGAYPNFHFDTAAAVSEIGRGDVSAARKIFLDWRDRALFGTDLGRVPAFEYPNFGAKRWDLEEYFTLHWRFFETAERDLPHPIPEQVSWRVTGIDLPDDVLHALYTGNAVRLYRLPLADIENPAGSVPVRSGR
ncbi:MAG TPA: amidohydrolase family protein [Solirubrobacteraceae bacterium]|jgi:predicted TIM-barrel fold metal-dependent hydrolase|nr:amidohydrolase family protein [Solirubrobacteraceae bacterium]